MTDQVGAATLAPPSLDFALPPRNKWEREFRAFRRLLPRLLQTERGKFVAVHEERVIETDTDEMALITRVLAKIGNVDFHVGRVTEEAEPMYRSGIVRDLSASEPA